MNMRRISYGTVGSVILLLGAVAPSATASGQRPASGMIAIGESMSGSYGASLTVKFSKPLRGSAATQVRSILAGAMRRAPSGAGPKGGAFLVCNKPHFFTDPDGTFSVQHTCGAKLTGWGYKISPAVCSFTISDVKESGMAFTTNGKRYPDNSPHDKYCGYQLHGAFNPQRDFDLVSYNDDLTFEVKVSGETGTADLHIDGSFYSAQCTNPSVCR